MRRASFAALLILAVTTLQPIAAAPPRLAEAIRAHQDLAQERPGDLEVLNDLGNLLVLAGEMTEAEQIYRQALDIDDEFAKTHYNLALLLHQTERRREAKRELQRALELRPNDPWTLYQLGTLYAEGGARSRALKHYSKAFSLEPRLTLADQNPHILDNELATQALLMAHSSPPAAKLAPRKYEQPTRITELLLPQSEEKPSSSAEESTTPDRPEAAEGEAGQAMSTPRHTAPALPARPARRRARTPQSPSQETSAMERDPVLDGPVPMPAEPEESDTASGSGAGGPADNEENPGSYMSGRNEEKTREGSSESSAGESSQETTEGKAESESEGEPEPEEAKEREATGIPRHEPAEPSTGRLDLRLVPTEHDRLASVR
jgi:Flp pilus assembly protein TadD